MFLGYNDDTKAYRIFVPSERPIIWIDVILDESCYKMTSNNHGEKVQLIVIKVNGKLVAKGSDDVMTRDIKLQELDDVH